MNALRYASRCERVELPPRYERLLDLAVDLHTVANDGSGERYSDGRSYRERARQGYRAELAVAHHYGLRPEIDYRPPGAGDPGRDFWAAYDGADDPVTIDVKATTSDPPRLYLTRKRATAERYLLPDYYLLASAALTEDDAVHLIGWASCEAVMATGAETEAFGNPVWRCDAEALAHPPDREALTQLPEAERLRHDADRLERHATEVDA